jgi:hypothetical protein
MLSLPVASRVPSALRTTAWIVPSWRNSAISRVLAMSQAAGGESGPVWAEFIVDLTGELPGSFGHLDRHVPDDVAEGGRMALSEPVDDLGGHPLGGDQQHPARPEPRKLPGGLVQGADP